MNIGLTVTCIFVKYIWHYPSPLLFFVTQHRKQLSIFFSNPLSNEMQNIVHVVRSFQLDAAYRMSSWMQHKSWFSVWFFFVGSSVSCSPVLCSLLLLPLAFCCSLSGFCITLFIFSDFPLPVFCQPPVLLPAFWILDFGFLCLAFGSFYSLTFAGK